MPIRPYLAGQAFEPESIREMSLALENARRTALPYFARLAVSVARAL